MTPEPIADYACNTGEGPLYHPDENRIYWTDIPAGRLFRSEVSVHELLWKLGLCGSCRLTG